METEILNVIIAKAQKFCFAPVTPDVDLFQIGLNSLNAVELLVELETHFQIKFEDDQLSLKDFETPGKLVDLVAQKLSAAQGPADAEAEGRDGFAD